MGKQKRRAEREKRKEERARLKRGPLTVDKSGIVVDEYGPIHTWSPEEGHQVHDVPDLEDEKVPDDFFTERDVRGRDQHERKFREPPKQGGYHWEGDILVNGTGQPVGRWVEGSFRKYPE